VIGLYTVPHWKPFKMFCKPTGDGVLAGGREKSSAETWRDWSLRRSPRLALSSFGVTAALMLGVRGQLAAPKLVAVTDGVQLPAGSADLHVRAAVELRLQYLVVGPARTASRCYRWDRRP